MKNIVIWGAGSGLGATMLDYFYEQGFKMTAITRNPSKNPKIETLKIDALACDATDKLQVEETVKQLPKEAIHISTMGSFNAEIPVDYIGHRYLIDALTNKGSISRFMLITSLGCGDSWQYLSDAAKRGFGGAVREKSLAESWLQSSTLDFTILRPGGLKHGAMTNTGELSQNKEVHGAISRAEVARLTHHLLSQEDSIGQIYQCIEPNLKY